MNLMTIGYEGMDSEVFFSSLVRNGVEVLVDVRELPVSRKKGFSKKALMAACEGRGIFYLHLPMLGSPGLIRRAYRIDGDWNKFSDSYLAHLRNQREVIQTLSQYVRSAVCCLLCFENDPRRCHRSHVSNALAEYLDWKLDIRHLGCVAIEPAAKQEVVADRLCQQSTIDQGIDALCPLRK